ncbi:hypothetical protein [Actinoplanes sp. NPDC051851]|uniref:hypothetical protein n=1 Tax=Actinoplanes sp. NPDC051851 TaxID=3154753 RepID=UPI0034151BCA
MGENPYEPEPSDPAPDQPNNPDGTAAAATSADDATRAPDTRTAAELRRSHMSRLTGTDRAPPPDPTAVASADRRSLEDEALKELVAAEKAGVQDLSVWIDKHDRKGPNEFQDTIAELREANRLASEYPDRIIRVGVDAETGIRPGTTNERMREFDIRVEAPDGRVERSVEVRTIEKAFADAPDLKLSIRHAADKVASRIKDDDPIPGQKDITIEMELPVGYTRKDSRTSRDFSPDGTVNVFSRGGRHTRSGNLFDDVRDSIPEIKNSGLLDRVTLIDRKSGYATEFNRQGSNWTRTEARKK